jgi:cytochrome c oxidase cbb3-type subunit 2
MNYGPLIFLAAFFALAGSWFGLVLTPQMQVGQLQQTNTISAGETYPVGRPGLAREGLEVYRANGCASCHSQQPGQNGTVCDVMLNEAGTNQPALVAALRTLNQDWSEARARECLAKLPQPLRAGVKRDEADAALKAVSVDDYLYDYPVMLGSQRIGPDLVNVGLRYPDVGWHLRHLYAPRLEVKDSIMAPYRFLFEQRKIERAASPDALVLPPEFAPPSGYEIVPKQEAKALVAYLFSLRADAPLYVAPLTLPPAPNPATNAPAATNGTVSLTIK